jgi:hypothetical protein
VVLAQAKNLLRIGLEHRPGALDDLPGAGDKRQKASRSGCIWAAKHGSSNVVASVLIVQRGNSSSGIGRYRAGANVDGVATHAGKNSMTVCR